MAHHLKLVSFDLCPYVERSRIVLHEKQVPHDLELIDLASKPAWFLAVSPMGRVPLLLVDGRPIFESMVINELLDELHPAPPLMPSEPIPRAEARGWVVFANEAVMPPSFHAMLALAGGETGDALGAPLAKLRDALGKLEAHLARGGPFFTGEAFTLVDAAYAPFFRRWRLVERWGVPEALLLARFPAVAAWGDALLARPSVRAAAADDFDGRLHGYFEQRARARRDARSPAAKG